MDVLMDPIFSIDVSAPQASDYSPQSPNHQRQVFLQHRVSAMVLKQQGEDEEKISISSMDPKGLGMVRSGKSLEDSSDHSSSIEASDDSEEEEEEGEESNSNSASSSSSSSMKKSLGSLGSLDALEDSLSIKRGLSNYFTGKSKSFTSLSDASLAVSKAKDLEKPEHPFNKRRRILMANMWTRRSSFYSWANPKYMPLLTLTEDGDEEAKEEKEEEEEQEDGGGESMTLSDEEPENEDRKRGQRKMQERKFNNSFKGHSCFSLTNLQQQQRLQQNL